MIIPINSEEKLLRLFYPYEYVNSVFTINYQELYNNGYRGLIFDIDNTLVPHGSDSTKETEQLFILLKNIGFKTLLLSNNNEKRIKRFIKNINTLYICNAEKPKTANYIKAVEMMDTDIKKTILIGDQVFTDILGANKTSMPNILVEYIKAENETKIGKKNIWKD